MDSTTKKNKYIMYMHAGSANHGCEAIVRGLCNIFGDGSDFTLLSNNSGQDAGNKINRLCDVIQTRSFSDDLYHKARFYVKRRLGHPEEQMKYAYGDADIPGEFQLALSIGGDNYCYRDALTNLAGANILFENKGVATALVGCSVEPASLTDEDESGTVIPDLCRYRYIIARESITYKALKKALPPSRTERIFLLPDPAFAMKPVPIALPRGFKPGHTIGINVSPMILGYESSDHEGITLNNYKQLIKVIMEETSDMIALIPHVTTPLSDDRIPLRKLYDAFADTGRVIMIEDHPAPQLKYIISKCRLLIAARTHASIAAYSTKVPTLVVGYSVKARGIAEDLFNECDGYVLPVQSLRSENDLADAYIRLEAGADEQRERLNGMIPYFEDQLSFYRDIIR